MKLNKTEKLPTAGKLMWAKGFTEMLDMLSHHKRSTGEALPVDAFGSGPDADQVRAASHGIPCRLVGASIKEPWQWLFC